MEDGATIGSRVTLSSGATVGGRAIVEAGSVVDAGVSIPSGEVWAGSPAAFVREVTGEDAAYRAAVLEDSLELVRSLSFLPSFLPSFLLQSLF